MFEQQAQRAPSAVAVIFGDQRLTYGELDQRANRLANYLQRLGVGPDVLVGLCVERSLEMVVGLLGILKAGGAYVPLDPDLPSERLDYMLADAQVPVLLTQQGLMASLPAFAGQVLRLDAEWPLIAEESAGDLTTSGVSTDNLAY